MKTQHTKGKWQFVYDAFYNKWCIKSETNNQIIDFCEVYTCFGYKNKFENTVYGEDIMQESKANAKLIAAAPELLEVAMILKRYIDVGENPTLKEIKFMDETIKKATE